MPVQRDPRAAQQDGLSASVRGTEERVPIAKPQRVATASAAAPEGADFGSSSARRSLDAEEPGAATSEDVAERRRARRSRLAGGEGHLHPALSSLNGSWVQAAMQADAGGPEEPRPHPSASSTAPAAAAAAAGGPAAQAGAEEELSKLSVRELKKRLSDAGVTVPASCFEKCDLVKLLEQNSRRPSAAAAPRVAPPEASPGCDRGGATTTSEKPRGKWSSKFAATSSKGGEAAAPATRPPGSKDLPTWVVVGGADFGGIKVRMGKELTSTEEAERLGTGAVVQELALEGERLHYERISGTGPAVGWVSLRSAGKPLLERRSGPGPAHVGSQPPAAAASYESSRPQGSTASYASSPPAREPPSSAAGGIGCDMGSRNPPEDVGGEAPLVLAVCAGDLREVEDLLTKRADPNVRDALGESPLFEAAVAGHMAIAKVLLTARADPLLKSPAGSTVLDIAPSTEMQALLQAGAPTGSAGAREPAKAEPPAQPPQESRPASTVPGSEAEDVSKLSLKEIKRRLQEAGVAIPPSAIEKADLVDLLQKAAAASSAARGSTSSAGAAGRQSATAPPSAAPGSARPGSFTQRAAEAREKVVPKSAELLERRKAPDGQLYTQQEFRQFYGGLEEWEAASHAAAHQAPAPPAPAPPAPPRESAAASPAARAPQPSAGAKQQAATSGPVAESPGRDPPPAANGDGEDISKLPIREIKRRLQEAGVQIPASAFERADLVALLEKASRKPVPKPASAPKPAGPTAAPAGPKSSAASTASTKASARATPAAPTKPAATPKRPAEAPAAARPKASAPPEQRKTRSSASTASAGRRCAHPKCCFLVHSDPNVSRTNCCIACQETETTGLPQHGGRCERRRPEGRDEEGTWTPSSGPGPANTRGQSAGGSWTAWEGIPRKGESLARKTLHDLKKRCGVAGIPVRGDAKEADLIALLQERASHIPEPPTWERGPRGAVERRRTVDAFPPPPQREPPRRAPAPPPMPASKEELWLTFGYIAGTDKTSPYARFDIRDEVCESYGFRHGTVVSQRGGEKQVVVGVKLGEGKPQLWFHPKKLGRAGSVFYSGSSARSLKSQFQACGEEELDQQFAQDFDAAEDSDGEVRTLCRRCRLPVGQSAYAADRGGALHGECKAELMTVTAQQEDIDRLQKDKLWTMENRRKYDIGWVPRRMLPINQRVARRLGVDLGGPLCCLLMHGDVNPTLSVVPACEPRTSVNLDYLITALQVRLHNGREPYFSLDPCPPFDDPDNLFQEKQFGPDWMRGSKAGEVLFQADYHLKELSMGEYDQAVVGMKSCFDFSDDNDEWNWRAREWFIVKNAEVYRTQDNVVMPHLEMGVEARVQIIDSGGHLVDAPMTAPNHPLVLYGDAFTHYFDLIAERLSVIYHLRELTKAQIIARFLVDSGVRLDQTWLSAMDEATYTELTLSQHRIGRVTQRICVRDGGIAEEDMHQVMHTVSGGVDLNLDGFDLDHAKDSDEAVLPEEGVDPWSLTEEELRQQILAHGGTVPPGIREKQDLIDILMGILETFKDFFWCISGCGPSPFSKDDQALFRRIFNSSLSDRRCDEEHFVPPTMHPEYLDKLRRLVKEERRVLEARKNAFLGKDFTPSQHSPPFPYCWRAHIAVAYGDGASRAPGEICGGRPLKKVSVAAAGGQGRVDEIVAGTEPIFDQSAEDGTRYRIYQSADLEVRTTQEEDEAETIGAVFTVMPAVTQSTHRIRDQEKVLKISECVRDADESGGLQQDEGSAGADASSAHYLCQAIIETDRRNVIVTEMLNDGTATWEENPAGMEERRARSKVVHCRDCTRSSVNVGQVKAYSEEQARGCHGAASASKRKRYARGAWSRLRG